MKLFESIVNMKINAITVEDLQQFAAQHQIKLANTEAEQITRLLRGKSIDIFNEQQRKRLLQEIESIMSKDKANQIEMIFQQFTGGR